MNGYSQLPMVALAVAAIAVCTAYLYARRLESQRRALARPVHELRGALTVLDLGLSLVERSPLSGLELAARGEGLRLQLHRARGALAEIDSFRDAGHGSVGGRLLERERSCTGSEQALVDLGALAGKRARAWAQVAPAYGATLRFAWRAGPARVRADGAQLEQALDNLIANALEHGGGRVVVEAERLGDRVRLSIADGGAGVGVPPHRRMPASSEHGHGLRIAAEAIERHGGTITSVSVRGRAAVAIELPVATPARERTRPLGVGVERAATSTASRAA